MMNRFFTNGGRWGKGDWWSGGGSWLCWSLEVCVGRWKGVEQASQTVVIHDPCRIDKGMVFVPKDGYFYFKGWLK